MLALPHASAFAANERPLPPGACRLRRAPCVFPPSYFWGASCGFFFPSRCAHPWIAHRLLRGDSPRQCLLRKVRGTPAPARFCSTPLCGRQHAWHWQLPEAFIRTHRELQKMFHLDTNWPITRQANHAREERHEALHHQGGWGTLYGTVSQYLRSRRRCDGTLSRRDKNQCPHRLPTAFTTAGTGSARSGLIRRARSGALLRCRGLSMHSALYPGRISNGQYRLTLQYIHQKSIIFGDHY